MIKIFVMMCLRGYGFFRRNLGSVLYTLKTTIFYPVVFVFCPNVLQLLFYFSGFLQLHTLIHSGIQYLGQHRISLFLFLFLFTLIRLISRSLWEDFSMLPLLVMTFIGFHQYQHQEEWLFTGKYEVA